LRGVALTTRSLAVNNALQVTYSLEDISYDVQQSHFTALKEKKRQKTGKV
jgi:hypothetical protein